MWMGCLSTNGPSIFRTGTERIQVHHRHRVDFIDNLSKPQKRGDGYQALESQRQLQKILPINHVNREPTPN
jgi:hypothetical protein